MENIKRVCTIIVTFNRKELLLRCLEAVTAQTFQPQAIFIVDNASTDGTSEYLAENRGISHAEISDEQKIDVSLNGQPIFYYRLSSNQGGAGGFYTGLKLAHESGEFDAYWLMDDDGYPSRECLERQLPYLDEYKYVMPVSIDINNETQLSWATRKPDGKKTIVYDELVATWGNIMPFIFPFNGSLMLREMVDKVGYINPKLFIWGDDYEHYFRCLKAGYNPVTILDAVFYHPVNRAPVVPIFFGKIPVPYVESKLRFHCLIRNWAYINKKNRRYGKFIMNFMAYSWLFLLTRKLDLKGYGFYLQSLGDGLRENFTRHKDYL